MKLKVRILLGRNFKQGNQLLQSTLVCSLRILSCLEFEGVRGPRSESVKSHPKRPDNDFIATWNDVMTLSHVLSYDAVLHVRVFEQHILKDAFVCESFLPLRQLHGVGLGSTVKGERERERERENGSPHSDLYAEGVKDESERSIKASGRDSGKGKDDHEGKSTALQAVKILEKEKEKEALHGAEDDSSMLHVFGSMFHSAHTALSEHIPSISGISLSSTPTTTTTAAASLKDDVTLSPMKGIASSCTSSRMSPSTVPDSTVDNFSDVDKVTEYPPRSPVTALGAGHSAGASAGAGTSAGIADKKASPSLLGSENIGWHKCYGRKADHEENVEKGEIYLGMQLIE
jgi:hypothetical protein